MADYVELEVPDNDDTTYNIKIRKESAARIRSLSASDRRQFMHRLVGRLRDSGIPKTQKTDATKKKVAKRKASNPEKHAAKPVKKEPKKNDSKPARPKNEDAREEAEAQRQEPNPERQATQSDIEEPASQENE
jgi:hypothetical protein